MLAVLTSGCYQYFPVSENAPLPAPGTEIRLRLDDPQALDLGTVTVNDVATVEGYVQSSGSDSLGLFSSSLRTFYGYRQRTNGAVFYFDRAQLQLLEERKLVPWKTGVAVGTSVAGLAAFMYFATDLGKGGQSGGEEPGDPTPGRVVIIPFPIKIPLPVP